MADDSFDEENKRDAQIILQYDKWGNETAFYQPFAPT